MDSFAGRSRPRATSTAFTLFARPRTQGGDLRECGGPRDKTGRDRQWAQFDRGGRHWLRARPGDKRRRNGCADAPVPAGALCVMGSADYAGGHGQCSGVPSIRARNRDHPGSVGSGRRLLDLRPFVVRHRRSGDGRGLSNRPFTTMVRLRGIAFVRLAICHSRARDQRRSVSGLLRVVHARGLVHADVLRRRRECRVDCGGANWRWLDDGCRNLGAGVGQRPRPDRSLGVTAGRGVDATERSTAARACRSTASNRCWWRTTGFRSTWLRTRWLQACATVWRSWSSARWPRQPRLASMRSRTGWSTCRWDWSATSIRPIVFQRAAVADGESVERLIMDVLHLLQKCVTPFLLLFLWRASDVFLAAFGPEWRRRLPLCRCLALPAFVLLHTSWLDRLLDIAGRQRLALTMETSFSAVSIVTVVIALAYWHSMLPVDHRSGCRDCRL